MIRGCILLTSKLNLTKLTFGVAVRCHACLASRREVPPAHRRDHLLPKNRSLSTSGAMKKSSGTATDQHDVIRNLLTDLLTSNGKGSTGRSPMVSEAHVKHVCSHYLKLDNTAKNDFLLALAQLCGVHHEGVCKAAKNLGAIEEKGAASLLLSEQRLSQSLMPGYGLLFTHIGRTEGGVKFLVDMRADILAFQLRHQSPSTDAHLRALSSTLKDMLAHWFSAGLLQLQTVTWKSSCEMLQKISECEAVHPVRDWADLKRRVGPYRRCFVYTHSSMPQEPVVVLHTALTNHIPANVQSIVGERKDQGVPLASEEPEDPARIKAAIFYSITSTQKGLRGIDLGNHLIKHAVRTLQGDFPQLDVFSSLSPIPGFRSWLLAEIGRRPEDGVGATLFTPDELTNIHHLSGRDDESEWATVRRLLCTNQWARSDKLVGAMESPLMRLCARYLYAEKHRGFALDSVANFHLRNGAVMWRLNWLGDTSPRGLTASCGMMVNYRYFLDSTLDNGQAYSAVQTVAATQQILSLVEKSRGLECKSSL